MLAPGPGSGGVTDQDRDELEATAPSAVPLGRVVRDLESRDAVLDEVGDVEVPLHEVTCGAGGDKVAGCGHDGGALSVDRHVAV
eukprot:COSAG01_NODE_3837_length_5647_cov_13.474139_5_plen_84_part_00